MSHNFVLWIVEGHQIIAQIVVFFGERQVQPLLKRRLMTLAQSLNRFVSSKRGDQAMVPVCT